jgi:hypothetical protein
MSATDIAVTFATWALSAQRYGARVTDPALAPFVAAFDQDLDAAAAAAAGAALVEAVRALLPNDAPETLQAAAARVFGAASAITGDDREARVRAARSWAYREGTPWLARCWERSPDGTVGPRWHIVERVTDAVDVLDPNPWDDIAEEARLPIVDFQVRWELSGCASVAVARAC